MPRISGVFGWLAVTLAASVISLGAVTLVGSSIGDQTSDPLSAAEVQRHLELTATGSATPSGGPTATSSPSESPTGTPDPTGSAAGPSELLSETGGSVVAYCTGGLAVLESWSPDDGFRVHDEQRGPARTASVEFRSDDDDRYTFLVSCQSSQPTLDVEHEERDDNSGPGGGDDDDNSGPG
ncbi:MAG: hypothetical protein L0Y54_07405 [Sporichthyaceae bacterium]|nr:hypothetical protein [Sporichthyaceae bacterium]